MGSRTRLGFLLPFVVAAATLLVPAPAVADVVTLNNGRKIEGRVVGETAESVKVETKAGVQEIAREDIARIERIADPKAEFATRKKALEASRGDAKAWFELGLWAADKKLEAEAKVAFEKAVALDADHAAAREKLGFEKVGKEWLPFAEAQKKKGLVEHQGRWVKPGEKEKLEQGYVVDPETGEWIKKDVLEARKAADEERARRARESEAERAKEREAAGEKPASPSAPKSDERAVEGRPVRVATFNIRFDFDNDGSNRWANRAALVAGLIQAAKVEIACLQEDKREQIEDLRKLMPGWEFVGKGRDGRASEACSIAFNAARWQCAESGDFWLSDTPDKVGSNTWGSQFPHKVTWARLQSGKREVLVLSTHFEDARGKDQVREKSARVIRDWLAANALEANVIVAGDFNATPDDAAHSVLLEPKGGPVLTDAWEGLKKSDPSGGTVHEFTGKGHKSRIDWILVGGNVVPRTIDVDRWSKDGKYPSDHFAVVAELEVGPRPRKPSRA